MKEFSNTIKAATVCCGQHADHFSMIHPYLATLLEATLLPLMILLAVCAFATVSILPISLICGWI